jgi:hypothetical protein
MSENSSIQELVEFLTKALVDNPEAVEVKQRQDGGNVAVEVCVASEDMGKVIGKRGRNINAVRTVAKAAAVKRGVRVDVEIVD